MAGASGQDSASSTFGLPGRAPVVPRVRVWPEGEILPLEHYIQRFLDQGGVGTVNVFGPPGSGKSMALRHLAAVFPPGKLRLLDDLPAQRVFGYGRDRPIVYTSIERCAHALLSLEMAGWEDDDLIEYLLHAHPRQCKSVMARLNASGSRDALGGLPELWAAVLEELAADESLADVSTALRRYLTRQLADPQSYAQAIRHCMQSLGLAGGQEPAGAAEQPPTRLLRHRLVTIVLASEKLTMDVAGGRVEILAKTLPPDLISETGRLLRLQGEKVLEQLAWEIREQPALQPTAVSLLLAADAAWRPANSLPNLSGAYLSGAHWTGVDLSRCDLTRADLSGADLSESILNHAKATGANLRRANLSGARLKKLLADEADLLLADLSCAMAYAACFSGANLEGANLSEASLIRARLDEARLSQARLVGADLRGAGMNHATLDGADFSNADLGQALLSGVRLGQACFTGASFRKASLLRCDLEYMDLPDAEFQGANLTGSYLTGSIMHKADFRQACLRSTGLADIDWEGADLRDADLTGASFHMGSSRSGLVNSPIASEGTRTGFYTDDYNDQDFKPPEEIRKANLCGCDLRGAKVEGADFYLVDLRGAKYNEEQAAHFARCGAILHSRS